MNGIKNKVILTVIAILAIIGLGSWYLLLMTSDPASSSIELTENLQIESVKDATNTSQSLQKTVKNKETDSAAEINPKVISNLTLLAVVVANPAENSSAVIQFNLVSGNYSIGDSIRNTTVVLEDVSNDNVTVKLDGIRYMLNLQGGEASPYSLSSNDSNLDDSEKTLTAKEIGNRPKQLDHIIAISPENNDYSVRPGLNPALFKAAKFKPGDILKSINGKDVTNPEELAQANALIATAQTLKFEVFRGGQTVTLYLDIPSKNLSFSSD